MEPSASASSGPVLIVSALLDGWLIFYARALIRAGHDVTFVANLDSAVQDHDHRDVLKHFLPNPFCCLIDFKDALKPSEKRYDFAVAGIQGASSAEEKREILALIGATPLRAVTLRRYNPRFSPMTRLLVKEMLHPFIRRSGRLLVEEYRDASWTFRLLSPVSRMGVVPHQRVTCQGMPAGFGEQTERTYLFNFLGTYDGDPASERVPIIDHLESRFQFSGGAQEVTVGSKTIRIMWHADRPGSKRERPLNQYLETLSNSFFTLCLSGDAPLTHRTLEAIQCGSIPVLSEKWMPEYALPLEHGRNCWLVRNKDWELAITALSTLDRKKILEMQSAVKHLARHEASIPSLERKCLHLLGLNHS